MQPNKLNYRMPNFNRHSYSNDYPLRDRDYSYAGGYNPHLQNLILQQWQNPMNQQQNRMNQQQNRMSQQQNPVPRQQTPAPQQRRDNHNHNNFYRHNQNRRNQELRERVQRTPNHSEHKLYICPSCSCQYDCLARNGRYIGKVPLVLNCKHTVCQECIYKSAVNDSIVCPVCKNPSVVLNKHLFDNLQEAFSPNFYVFGLILWCKTQGADVREMTLVPAQKSTSSKKSSMEYVDDDGAESGESCCFLSCTQTATLRCQDCNDVYCMQCCTTIHKSAKSLWSHKQVPITNGEFSIELENCPDHKMDIEFFCRSCRVGACCYCLIEKHEGHEKDHLSKLNNAESIELSSYKAKAEQILKQLLVTQRKVKDLSNFSNSAVEKKICNYFINLYSRLQFLERNLRKEASGFQEDGKSSRGLDGISSKLGSSIDRLKNLLSVCEAVNKRKLNLKAVLKKLQEVQQIPCYLLNDSTNALDPIQFVIDPVMDVVEEHFKVIQCGDVQYNLVSEDQLPSDYEKDPLDHLYESDAESTISSIVQSIKKENNRAKKKKSDAKRIIGETLNIPTDNEMVEVTHIESLERFYVQHKKMQFRLMQMNREINNYIKMAAKVEHPQLNELYLALYETKKEKMWCRGRLSEIKNGETEPLYEMFFIDYGSTQTLDISKLREITPGLSHRKPLAIQCELYNPTYVRWGKNAHVYMGKIINGKDVYMMVKGVNSGIHQVDLMVSSSDRNLTSIIDILIHTCSNAWNTSSDSSAESNALHKQCNFAQEHTIFTNSIKFHKNQIQNVIIANVIDPHHIFVHIADHADSLRKMTNSLKAYYKHGPPHSTFIPIEGSYVIVEHKDPIRGNWHRALIKKVDMTNEKALVLCVDWGNNITVPWSHIRMLTEHFTKLESQAVLVKLAHVEPHQKAHVWTSRATSFLQKNFRTQDILKMIVYREEPLEVALFEVLINVDVCINTQLVEEKLADSTGKISQTLEWPQNVAELKGFSEDEGLVATLLKKVDEQNDEDESDDEENKALVKQKIEVVKFTSPDLIYIKFVRYEAHEQNLHRELQIHYFNERKTKDSWEENENCVVQYINYYVRGKIISKEGDSYKVNVYDKATELLLPKEKIYVYSNYFNKYPNIVFKSHLANIRPAGGENWSMSSAEALESIFEKYKDIFATKVSCDISRDTKSIPLQMWYTQIKMGGALEASVVKYISINNFLVKLGFAYKQQPTQSTKRVEDNTDVPTTSADVADLSADSETDSIVKHLREIDMDSDKISATGAAEKANTTASSTDWNEIVEEEEKVRESKEDSPYHTKEADIEDWIPAIPLKQREFNAWLTCAEIGGIIYLRDENLQAVYKEMENNIKEYFDKNSSQDENHNWQPGQLCTIFSNNFWYRGKVYKVNSPDDIIVVMIDFGSDHNVTSKDLYREILYPKIPAFASKIKLDRVFAKSGGWISSDYETLMDILTEYGKVVIKGPLDDEIPSAEVFTDKGVNVNQALVQKCPNLTRCLNTDGVVSDDEIIVIEEETLQCDDDNDNDNDDDNEMEALLGATPVDTTDFEYRIESLPDEEKIELSVIAILGYNKIVLKKPDNLQNEKVLELGSKMQQLVKHQPTVKNLKLGMPCICPYSEDNLWYRSQIYNVDALDCGYIFVFFVDFGNVEPVPVKHVKMMRPEWFDLPVSCHIAFLNFDLKTDNHVEYVFQYIKKLFGTTKIVDIVKKDPLTVNLFDADDQLSYKSLLESGLLKVKDN